MNTPERILVHTQELFYRYGTRSVTMDDIAKNIGISKKTIYQFFDDKESIVMAMMKTKIKEIETETGRIAIESKDAVQEILNTMVFINQVFSNLNPGLFYDLQKFHPKAWKLFVNHRNTYMKNCITNNLIRGIKEELYRDDLDIELTAKLRLCQIDNTVDPELFPGRQFDLKEVNLCSLDLYLHSIVNTKGHRTLDKYTKQISTTKKKLTA